MPSNKIITIFIICIGIVISVWLFTRNPSSTNLKSNTPEKIVVKPSINIEKPLNDDWKKILVSVDTKNQKTVDLTKNKSTSEEDTTLTDQMSRDFMSQYLMAVKEGIDVTPEVASKIARSTLSMSTYQPSSVVYIKENLKISPVSKSVLNKYKENINQAVMSVYYSVKDEPTSILISALQTENEAELKRLDPIITINKLTIKSLLAMEVPESAVKVHLELLNASSLILSDLESMRVAISDPVKVFSAVGSYTTNLGKFKASLANLDLYLLKNSI